MSTRKKLTLGLGVMLAIGVLYLSLWPVPIEPVAWTPPTAPAWKLDDSLAIAKSVSVAAHGVGAEDIAVDGDGRIYAGLANGKVLRFANAAAQPEVLVDTGGRPLGMDLDGSGNLWICDASRGLLRLSPSGELEVMATECDGVPFRFTNDVDMAPNGAAYFTDASSRFGLEAYKLDLLEHGANGRLMVLEPGSKAPRLLLGGLQFANGVALSPDGRFVLVCETGNYRILRYWLQGEQAGEHEVFAENLPGFPDGISTGSQGRFWLALASPRDPILDGLLPHPFLRKVLVRLPEAVHPAPQRHGWVLGFDAQGKIVHDLQHLAPDSISPITSVEQHGDELYLGTLTLDRFGIASTPAP